MNYYTKIEREAVEELEKLLEKPVAPNTDMIGSDEYFDPWDIFPIYGSYSSAFDDMALEVLQNMLDKNRKEEELAHEMFREMLCYKGLCDYGTSPRVCFPTEELEKLLPKLIKKWKLYYSLMWEKE